MGLSVNDFVARYGTPDAAEKNINRYSDLLKYEPNTSQGYLARAFFERGSCAAVMARLPAPVPLRTFVPDDVFTKIQNAQFQRAGQSNSGRVLIGMEDFETYWFFELDMPVAKSWDASTGKVEKTTADISEAKVTAFANGKKNLFLETLRRVPELGYITTEDFFKPGKSLPTDKPGLTTTP
jgi:hypothetical protein